MADSDLDVQMALLEKVLVEIDELNADGVGSDDDVEQKGMVAHRLTVLDRHCRKWSIKTRIAALTGDVKLEVVCSKEHRGYEKQFKETAATRQTDLYEEIVRLKNEEAGQAAMAASMH